MLHHRRKLCYASVTKYVFNIICAINTAIILNFRKNAYPTVGSGYRYIMQALFSVCQVWQELYQQMQRSH